MSGLAKSLFRPGKGNVIQKFTAAFVEGTTYPADWLALTTTATSGQGSGADGVVDGKTLGSEDFVYAALADTDSVHEGLQLGVAMGSGIGTVADWSDVSGDSVAADNLCVIQCWGVHPQVRTDGDGAAGTVCLMSSTAGEANCIAIGTTVGTDAYTMDLGMGIALDTDAAYTGAVAETGSAAFVRCNF